MRIPADMKVGSTHPTNDGVCKVVKYESNEKVTIVFVDTNYKCTKKSSHIRSGQIKDRLKPAIHGVGFIGDGNFKSKESGKETKAYTAWINMIRRCYDEKYQELNPTYLGCSICEDWRNFQNFAEWYQDNYISGCDLDKDIMVSGNKIYSPRTCKFATRKENVSQAHAKNYKFKNKDMKLFYVYNLSDFCVENHLSYGEMVAVNSGRATSHKGWVKG